MEEDDPDLEGRCTGQHWTGSQDWHMEVALLLHPSPFFSVDTTYSQESFLDSSVTPSGDLSRNSISPFSKKRWFSQRIPPPTISQMHPSCQDQYFHVEKPSTQGPGITGGFGTPHSHRVPTSCPLLVMDVAFYLPPMYMCA